MASPRLGGGAGHRGPPPAGTAPARSRSGDRRRGASLFAGAVGGYVAGSAADGAEPADSVAVVPASLDDTAGDAIDVAGVVDSVGSSVVSIQTSVVLRQGPFETEGEGAGTGVVLDDQGHVLTNAHVVEGAERGHSSPWMASHWPATVVGSDPSNDIAVFRVDDPTGLSRRRSARRPTCGSAIRSSPSATRSLSKAG